MKTIPASETFSRLYFEAKAELTCGNKSRGLQLAIAAAKIATAAELNDVRALVTIAGIEIN